MTGSVVLNMGEHTAAIIPMLERLVPDERFVAASAAPEEGAEVLATLAAGGDAVESLLGPSMRWIHVLGAGVDGIALDAIGERILTCSRGASAVAIAEYVLASMLAFEKRLPETWVTEPPERWNVVTPGLGTLRGRVLGLVGVGAIGLEVARRALAFDMRVRAVRRSGGGSPLPGIEVVASLPALLAETDHLVIAAPATPSTYHLIDGEALAACKPGVHVVNVARGSLVDQDALLAALDRGLVAAASLDVVDPEPLPAGHPLYTHPRVRLSPHISWSSPDTVPRTLELFVANLRRYRAGEPLDGVVHVDAGY